MTNIVAFTEAELAVIQVALFALADDFEEATKAVKDRFTPAQKASIIEMLATGHSILAKIDMAMGKVLIKK